jgi:transcriptional regulator GlxA family with amidase domain
MDIIVGWFGQCMILPLFERKNMKHLTIVVPEGQNNFTTIACIAGAYELFIFANMYHVSKGKKKIFNIDLAGISGKMDFYEGMLTVKPKFTISSIRKTDLLIIPSFNYQYKKVVKENKLLIDWIEKQYLQGAEVASMCTGAFMLASSGLLDGKTCSTHWAAADNFRKMFPKVKLETDKLITDEMGIYTNGGGYSFLNLVVYLIEKYYDRETAIYCSKLFEIEMDRHSQSVFTIFTGQKQHGDEMVKKAQAYIENKLHEKISVEDLSSKFSIGRRNFDRRFIKATGNTPVEYSQRVKIESAKKSFETTRKTINEVMYDVGYTDVKAFRELFKKYTGMSPLEYRSKYNKEARR